MARTLVILPRLDGRARIAGALARRGHRVHMLTAMKADPAVAASLVPADVTVRTLTDDSTASLAAIVRRRTLEAGDGLFVAGYGGAAAAVRDSLVELAFDRPLVGLAVGAWDAAWSDEQIQACDLFLAGSTVDRAQLARRRFDPGQIVELAGVIAPDLMTTVPDRARLLALGIQPRQLAVAILMAGDGELARMDQDVRELAATVPDLRLLLIGEDALEVPAGWPATAVAREQLSLAALAACDAAIVAAGGAAGLAAATEARSLGLPTLEPGATSERFYRLLTDAVGRGELARAALEESETGWWGRGAEACESLLTPLATA